MSEAVGPIAVIPRDGSGPLLPGAAEVSPETQRLIDEEVRRLVEQAHREVVFAARGEPKAASAPRPSGPQHCAPTGADAYLFLEVMPYAEVTNGMT
jgi:hypothetical protein